LCHYYGHRRREKAGAPAKGETGLRRSPAWAGADIVAEQRKRIGTSGEIVTATSIPAEDGLRQSEARELLADAIFKKASYLGLARLLPHTEERTVEAGEYLYRAGQAAAEFYYVLEGAVNLVSRNQQVLARSSLRIGEEAATDFDNYLTDAVAGPRTKVLVIPRSELASLLDSSPGLRAEFYLSLMRLFGREHLNEAGNGLSAGAPSASKGKRESLVDLVGWLLTLIAPALILRFAPSWGLETNAVYFLAIMSSTIVMWVFALVDDYIPGFFALLATLTMSLVPASVILSGLSSHGFVLAMSILGLSSVIVVSGLSYRLLLVLLKMLPNAPFWQNSALLCVGFLLTPLIPSANGRVAMVSPFLSDMLVILHQKERGFGANRLAVSAFTGVSLLSGIFLSSKSVNFIIFGLLPSQIQDQFQWLNWLYAAAATGLVLLLLYFVQVSVMFRGEERPRLSKQQVAVQLSLLGKMKNREWAAVLGVVVFMAGIVTTSIHKVASPWLGMAILFGILLFGVMNKKEFREKIDWPFLIYLGGIVGITRAIDYLGLGDRIAENLPWLGEYMHTNFPLFILLLSGAIFVVRLAVPISATIVIMATVLMPVAVHYGVNPWLVGFVILIVGEMWFFPYQCSYYLQFKQLAQDKIYDESMFLKFNALSNLAKIAAIYASIPYWKWFGIL
jgi:di/tricarboxylate transporter